MRSKLWHGVLVKARLSALSLSVWRRAIEPD